MNAPHPILPLDAAGCLGVVWQSARPRQRVTVSEWADRHRILTEKQSGEPGRWRTARNPILAEIMDVLSIGSRVTDVVIKKSSQVGVSESMVNWLGYIMDHARGPALVMMPTLELRDKWKTQKLNPLLTDTPVIRDLLGGLRSRDAANRQDQIDFPGGVVFLGGGNSANSYKEVTARWLLLDDLDGFPDGIADTGDVVSLAEGRTKSYSYRAKRVFVSTPTVEGKPIDRLYESSDQRRYHVPCPHCHDYIPLEWGGKDIPHGIKYSLNAEGEVHNVRYVCQACGAEIHEHQKPPMLAHGRWIAEQPQRRMRGYHINALYAPIGLGPSWQALAEKWVAAQSDTEKLRVFVNEMLGEVYTSRGSVDPIELLKRLEDYDPAAHAAAHPGMVRTVGIDVQKNRLEMSEYLVGEADETWYVAHHIVEGDTAGPEPWAELADLFAEIRPDCGGIDSGYATDAVVAFARHYPWLYVCKGIEGRGKTLIEDDLARRQRLRRKRKKGISPFLVSDHAGMALITQRLALPLPADPALAAPGVLHFPRVACFDDEFFAQLASNALERKTVRGKQILEWCQRKPNEAYDCWKYGFAGFRLSKLDPAARARAAKNAEPRPAQPAIRRLGRVGRLNR